MSSTTKTTPKSPIDHFLMQFEHKWRWHDSAEECAWAWLLFAAGLVCSVLSGFTLFGVVAFTVGLGIVAVAGTVMAAIANRFGSFYLDRASSIQATYPMMFPRHQARFDLYCKELTEKGV